MRRLAIVRITPELIMEICKAFTTDSRGGTVAVIANALPSDASFVRFTSTSTYVEIVLESAQFEPIAEGEAIPILDPPSLQWREIAD